MENNSQTQLRCLGLNYRTAPVAVRERFAVPRSGLVQGNTAIAALEGVQECVLLSTCNRTEIYYWTENPDLAHRNIMAHFFGGEVPSVASSACFYDFQAEHALEHLACVAAGLDSMVVGETEIFGQLKDAYRAAQEAGSTASAANRTFQRVFTAGKKVRTETQITSGPTSLGAVAVQLAGRALGSLEGSNVLVVGAGEIARSTAQSLRSRGAESIFVANRSYDRAVVLAEQVGGKVIRFSEWVPYLEQIDIVIVSTASPAYVVTAPVLKEVLITRSQRPLFLIDLSVPRNVDPACAEIPGVHLYDIDDMQGIVSDTHSRRSSQIEQGLGIIRAWLRENAPDILHRSATL